MFASLRNLQVLDLSDNLIINIEGDALRSVTSLKYLDLSRNPMQTLAAGFLCDAPGLEILLMQGTHFHGFPIHIFDCYGKLLNLSYIDFSDSLMHSIPHNAFRNIPNVQALNLTSNNINNSLILRDAFVGLTQLVSIDFTENDLTSIPETLCIHAPQLRYLYMCENRLTVFDFQAIEACQNLLFLDLSHNDIKSLVGAIELPSPLLTLRVSKNFISELSDDGFLRGAGNLTTLDLSMNIINRISANAFQGLSSLQKLDISDNSLKNSTLPPFSLLQSLTELDISVNSFNTIQSGFFNGLNNLKVLNLSRNDLELLQDRAFDGLGRLTTLDLRHNHILKFPDGVFSPLTGLKTLLLSQNRILTLDTVNFPKSIVTLDIEENRLEHFPNSLSDTNVKEVNLDFNEISVLAMSPTMNFSSITSLSLFRNRLRNFEENSFQTFTNLQHLNLSDNHLVLNLSRDYFGGADSLITLDLSRNAIQSINGMFATFTSLYKLQTLDLSRNPITHVKNLIPQLLNMNAFQDISLQNIYLSFCNISHVSVDVFDGFPFLNWVDLSGNKLTGIKPFKTPSLNTIYKLTRNPFQCSCSMRWLTENNIKMNDAWISTHHYVVDNCIVFPKNYTMKIREVPKFNFLCKTQDECPEKCSCLGTSESNNTAVSICTAVTRVPHEIPRTSVRIYLDGNSLSILNFTKRIHDSFLTEELYINNSNVKFLSRDFFRPFIALKKLVLSDNNIEKLPMNIFADLKNLEELYLRNNSLQTFISEDMPAAKDLKLLDISHNKISHLDPSVLENMIGKIYLNWIFIGSNPYICNCQNQALRYWIDEHISRILDRDSVFCQNNRELLRIEKEYFTCVTDTATLSSSQKKITVTSVILVCALLLVFVSCFYFRRDIIAVMGTKLNIKCLRHKYDDHKVYDVFLMYDFNDPKGSDWTNKELLPRLIQNGYKFTTSESVDLANSLLLTVNTNLQDSKCAVFVVTKYISNNQYCMNCFRVAFRHAQEHANFRLIVVVVGDIDHSILEPELRKRLSTGNYITARSRFVWERLAYELPEKRHRLEPFSHDNEGEEFDTGVIVYKAAGPGCTDEYDSVQIR